MAELSRLLKGGGRREGDTYRRFESKGVKDQITVNVAAYVLLLPVEYFIHDRFHLVSRRLARLILARNTWRRKQREKERERDGFVGICCAITCIIALGDLDILPFCIFVLGHVDGVMKIAFFFRFYYARLFCLLSFLTSNFILLLIFFLLAFEKYTFFFFFS